MRKALTYILLFAVLTASCGRNGRIIPEKILSQMYVDMLLTDEWIKTNALVPAADTSLVYEPIFRKYGYTKQDYLATVDKYMNNASKFSEVFAETESILLEGSENALRKEKHRLSLDSLRRRRESLVVNKMVIASQVLSGNYPTDTVRFEEGENGAWNITSVALDTSFSGPAVIVRDTTSVVVEEDSVDTEKADDTKVIKPSRLPAEVIRPEMNNPRRNINTIRHAPSYRKIKSDTLISR